jgi:hypothetical protein
MSVKARYSGNKSVAFWDRVNRLPWEDHRVVYSLGCVLQDLEARTLVALENAERQAARNRANCAPHKNAVSGNSEGDA